MSLSKRQKKLVLTTAVILENGRSQSSPSPSQHLTLLTNQLLLNQRNTLSRPLTMIASNSPESGLQEEHTKEETETDIGTTMTTTIFSNTEIGTTLLRLSHTAMAAASTECLPASKPT